MAETHEWNYEVHRLPVTGRHTGFAPAFGTLHLSNRAATLLGEFLGTREAVDAWVQLMLDFQMAVAAGQRVLITILPCACQLAGHLCRARAGGSGLYFLPPLDETAENIPAHRRGAQTVFAFDRRSLSDAADRSPLLAGPWHAFRPRDPARSWLHFADPADPSWVREQEWFDAVLFRDAVARGWGALNGYTGIPQALQSAKTVRCSCFEEARQR